jgi:uncharacterized protein (TIGR02391 family)
VLNAYAGDRGTVWLMTVTVPKTMGATTLESVARAVGAAFTNTVIDGLLVEASIPNHEACAKWQRVLNAVSTEIRRSGYTTCVFHLIQVAATPQRWVATPDRFEDFLYELNRALAFEGLQVGRDGSITQRDRATTIEYSITPRRRLHDELVRRGAHSEIFKYCTDQLIAEDCFNSVFEAIKGLAERIRNMSGEYLDGYALVAAAFEGKSPSLAFNSLRTETERNEQIGLANLMKGGFSAFRNPPAHEPKITWYISETDALDLLTMLSLLHRRLDVAVRVP